MGCSNENMELECDESGMGIILSLTGIKLTFFIAVHIELCFVFVVKTVLVTHWFLSVPDQNLHGVKAFSFSCFIHCYPPVSRLEWERGWEKTQPEELTQIDKRRVLYHRTSYLAIKAHGKKLEEIHSFLW